MEETKQGLLRGKGATLGTHALHYEMEDRVMLRVLQDRANDRGEHPWLICDLKDSLTFSEGWNLVCQIGRALVRDGYEGSHVALLMRNQIEFMPSMHGTHAARGVAIPLNAVSRGAHLKHMFTKGVASVIIVRDEFLERITDLDDIGLVTKIIVVGKAPEIQKIHKAEVVSFEKWIGKTEKI